MEARRACVFSLTRRLVGSLDALHGLGLPIRGSMRCIAICHCFLSAWTQLVRLLAKGQGLAAGVSSKLGRLGWAF